MRHFPRSEDEAVLGWVKLRRRGKSCIAIGAAYRTPDTVIRAATDAVKRNDMNHGSDSPAEIRKGYW